MVVEQKLNIDTLAAKFPLHIRRSCLDRFPMKYCRFQQNTQAQYGLVESVAGRDAIVRILLTPPEGADGDMESLRTRRIEPIALERSRLAAAGPAFEDRLRWTQLPRARRRTW